jgi:threonine dehydrogenase-like Zn-dependent dehydrogenase
MKAILYQDVGQIKFTDIVEDRPLNSDWVRVKVKAAGLCGSGVS